MEDSRQMAQRFSPVLAFVAVALSAVTLVASPAASEPLARPCEVGRPLVDVTYRIVNEQDLASNGEVWALDSAVSRFRWIATNAGDQGDIAC